MRLASGADYWYQGGGAFQPGTFGYVALSPQGRSGLATLYDVSADLAVTPRFSVNLYYGYASSGGAATKIYASTAGATLAYVELMFRF